MPPPTPVPSVTPMTSVYPLAPPTHTSPRHMQLASLATVTGRWNFSSSFARMGAADVVGQAAAGAGHNAPAAVDLARGRDADALQHGWLHLLRLQKALCCGQHGVQNGGQVAVEADALLCPGEDRAPLVHKAQLDRRAADVNGKILVSWSSGLTCGRGWPWCSGL